MRFVLQLHLLTYPFGAPSCHLLLPETLGFLKVWVLIVMLEFVAMLAWAVLPLAFDPGLAPALAMSSAANPVSALIVASWVVDCE